MKQLFFIWASLLLLCGCNDNGGVQMTKIADQSAVFRVAVDAVVRQDDQFSVFYTQDGSVDFSKNPPIWKAVKGQPALQKIVFDLPPDTRPSQLRIDLGNNPNQGAIKLHKIWLTYKGSAIEFPGTLIFSYFQPDIKKTKFNATTGIVSGKAVGGQMQSPSLYPKQGPLTDQLEKLFAR